MSLVPRGIGAALLATTMLAGSAMLPATHFCAGPAFAHGGGGGGGGGNGDGGGGHGGGGHGGGLGASDSGKGSGHGHGGSSSHGSSGRHGSAALRGKDPSNKGGSLASKLGALNAAHASPTALAHAAPNSRVGRIAAYEAALDALNIANANLAAANTPANIAAQAQAQQNAAQALANAANKGITASTVTGLNSLLGESLTAPTTADALATQAAGLQKGH